MQASVPSVRSIQLTETVPNDGTGKPLIGNRMDVLRNVKARVRVVAGHAETSVADLLGLQQGAVLTLEESVGTLFDVELEGAVIARGELVAVGDQFGIRVREIAPRTDQVQS